jgi:hypothetical protein
MVEGSAEELIRKELKAVAEGVAASVFQSANSNPEPTVSESSESAYEPNQEKEVSNEGLEIKQKSKFEVLNPFCFHCTSWEHVHVYQLAFLFLLPLMVALSDYSLIPIICCFVNSGHEEKTA